MSNRLFTKSEIAARNLRLSSYPAQIASEQKNLESIIQSFPTLEAKLRLVQQEAGPSEQLIKQLKAQLQALALQKELTDLTQTELRAVIAKKVELEVQDEQIGQDIVRTSAQLIRDQEYLESQGRLSAAKKSKKLASVSTESKQIEEFKEALDNLTIIHSAPVIIHANNVGTPKLRANLAAHQQNYMDLYKRQEAGREEKRICNTKMTALQTRIKQLKIDIDRYTEKAVGFATHRDEEALKQELVAAQEKFISFATRQQTASEELAKAKKAQINLAKQIELLEEKNQHDKTAQEYKFINLLDARPAGFFNELASEVEKQLRLYEDSAPAGQSADVRICLLEIPSRIRQIRELNFPIETESKRSSPQALEAAKLKFYQLSGYLQDVLYRLNHPISNVVLGNHIDVAFNSPVFLGGQLNPNECQKEYLALRKVHAKTMRQMTSQELRNAEIVSYEAARHELLTALKSCPKSSPEFKRFYANGKALAAAVHDQKSFFTYSGFDLKFNTTILQKAKNVLAEPANEQTCNIFGNLIEHVKTSKVASVSKQVIGAMTGFLGAAIVVGTLLTSPISLSSMVLGGIVLVAGYGLFSSGRKKALRTQMHEWRAAADNLPVPPFRI